MVPTPRDRQSEVEQFQRQAEQPPMGVWAEFLDFVLHNKKWWLTPILVVLLLVGLLAVIGASGLAPFIYSLY